MAGGWKAVASGPAWFDHNFLASWVESVPQVGLRDEGPVVRRECAKGEVGWLGNHNFFATRVDSSPLAGLREEGLVHRGVDSKGEAGSTADHNSSATWVDPGPLAGLRKEGPGHSRARAEGEVSFRAVGKEGFEGSSVDHNFFATGFDQGPQVGLRKKRPGLSRARAKGEVGHRAVRKERSEEAEGKDEAVLGSWLGSCEGAQDPNTPHISAVAEEAVQKTSEAGGKAENKEGSSYSKKRRGRAAGKRKNRGSFMIQLSNITSWSAKAKSWVGAQQSDVQIVCEHHLLPCDLDKGCSYLKVREWRCFASPAERSEGGEGTSGGTLVAVRSHFDARPVASATPARAGWRCKPETPYSAAAQITLGHRQVLILGGYCRGGIETREAGEMMRAWQDLTAGGEILFVAGADFNVNPEVLRNSIFLESIKGVVISSGSSTCTGAAGEGNELDYFIVHRDLAPNVVRCSRDWAVPFAPHATLRLEMSFQQNLMSKLAFRLPRILPEGLLENLEESDWLECKSEASKWVCRRKALEAERVDMAPSEDPGQRSEEVAQAEEATALATHLGTDYWAWCNALERAVLRGSQVPKGIWTSYMGRGAPPALVVVKIGENREGPLPSIKVEANQSASGRLLATWLILVNNISRKPNVQVWKSTLLQVLTSHGEEAKKLVAMVGHETHARLVSALRKVAAGLASDLELVSAASRLRAVEKVVKRKGDEERSAAQAEWRKEALSGGARGAHAFANLPNVQRQVEQGTLLGECLPSALAREQTEVWGSKWLCTEEVEVANYRRHMQEFRLWAMSQRGLNLEASSAERESWRTLLTPEKVVAAASSFKMRTGIGTDNLHFKLVKQAPAIVLQDLCGLFTRCVEGLIWPEGQTLTLLHLIQKRVGYRTVGTLTTFVRLLLKMLSPALRRWDSDTALPFDSAAPGQRADDHVFCRQATMESWAAAGKQTGQILWDIASFYEEIRPADLVQDIKDTKFPVTEACLGLLNHGGRRILSVDGAFGPILEGVGRSIVTGCTTSTSLARAFMARPLANLVEMQASILARSGADLQCSIHVDDLATFGSASSEEALVEALMEVSTVFVEEMEGRGMKISSKTVILMTKRSLGSKVQRYLQKRFGLTVLVEETGSALGIEVSANHRVRRTKVVRARFCRARKRAERGGWLAAKDRRAVRLFASGAAPMAEYGAATNGLSPGYLDKLDSMAARAAGANGFNPCPISLSVLHLGFVPSARAIGKQASAWIRNWNKASQETRSSWGAGWQQTRDLLTRLPTEERWRRVTGPIGATIATLLHIGWAPIQASHWLARDRASQAIIGRGSWEDAQIVKAIEEEAELLSWKRASTRAFAAEEMSQGPPCWEGVKRAVKKLKKLGLEEAVQGLHKVAVGGGVFGERLFLKQCCDRCGAEVETPEHRYYSCPANANIVGEVEKCWLQKSDWLAEEVRRRGAPERLLWCRGVLPFNRSGRLAQGGPGEVSTSPFQWAIGSSRVLDPQAEGCCLYTDGSGGGSVPFPCLQRAGSGAVWFGLTQEGRADLSVAGLASMGAVAAAVPGKQTVPRAEVWAGVAAAELEAAGRGRNMLRWTVDARYVQTGSSAIALATCKQRSLNGKDFGARPNNDLWQEIEASISSGRLPAASWMKSHQTLEEVAAGTLAIEDYFGNALADSLAGIAAEVSQEPGLVLREAEKQATLSFFVCMRIAIIERAVKTFKEETDLNYIMKGKVKQITKARAAKEAEWKLEDSGHVVTGHGAKFLRCSGCGNIRPLGDLAWWSTNSCSGFGRILEEEPGPTEEAELEPFVGKLPEFLALKKKRKVLNDATSSRNSRRKVEATGRLIAAKLGEASSATWQGGELAGPQPVWCWKLDTSHKLFFGGGGVFCGTCGACNSRARAGKLHKPCSCKLVEGSAWRLHGLMQGRCSAWKSWPDGRSGKTRICMEKVDVGLARLDSDVRDAELVEVRGSENRG